MLAMAGILCFGVLLESLSNTMGQQIAGTHLKYELLLYSPVSKVVETGAEYEQRV